MIANGRLRCKAIQAVQEQNKKKKSPREVYLILYHTIPTFIDLAEEGFLKTLWEKEKKMLVTTMFSRLSRRNFTIWATCDLLSANALNLDHSKILSFGRKVAKGGVLRYFVIP